MTFFTMDCSKSCYNFDVMNETEFIEKEISLIEDIKSSSVYLRYKELSKMIEEDATLIALRKERDEILLKIDSTSDPEKKEELMSDFKQKENQINETDLMKEYRIYYEKVRRIINHLTNGLNKEIL